MDDCHAREPVAGAGAISAQPRTARREQAERSAGVVENDGGALFGGEILAKAIAKKAARAARLTGCDRGIKHAAWFFHIGQVAKLDWRAHEDNGALELSSVRSQFSLSRAV